MSSKSFPLDPCPHREKRDQSIGKASQVKLFQVECELTGRIVKKRDTIMLFDMSLNVISESWKTINRYVLLGMYPPIRSKPYMLLLFWELDKVSIFSGLSGYWCPWTVLGKGKFDLYSLILDESLKNPLRDDVRAKYTLWTSCCAEHG